MSKAEAGSRPTPDEYRDFLASVGLASIDLIQIEASTSVRWPVIEERGAKIDFRFNLTDWHIEPDSPEFVGFVRAHVRISTPEEGTEAQQELAKISCLFGAVYVTEAEVTRPYLDVFAQNVNLHVWPYFRQLVADTTARFGWQPLTLPMSLPAKRTSNETGDSD